MTGPDNLKTLVDCAIEYGSKKSDAIIARVIQTKNSQIRFPMHWIHWIRFLLIRWLWPDQSRLIISHTSTDLPTTATR